MIDNYSEMPGPERSAAKRIMYTHRDIERAREGVYHNRPRCIAIEAVGDLVVACVDDAVDAVYKGQTQCPGSISGWRVFVGNDCIREFHRRLSARMSLLVRCDHMLRSAERSSTRTMSELIAEHGFDT